MSEFSRGDNGDVVGGRQRGRRHRNGSDHVIRSHLTEAGHQVRLAYAAMTTQFAKLVAAVAAIAQVLLNEAGQPAGRCRFWIRRVENTGFRQQGWQSPGRTPWRRELTRNAGYPGWTK